MLLAALTQTTPPTRGSWGAGPVGLGTPGDELLNLIVDDDRPGTLAHAVRRLLDCAYAVRDQLSGDTWLVVGALDREIGTLRHVRSPSARRSAAHARPQ